MENTNSFNNKVLFIPNKAFFNLKEVCELKGLNYKTALNKPSLQPISDGRLGGRKVYCRNTVIDWLYLTDYLILSKKEVSDD